MNLISALFACLASLLQTLVQAQSHSSTQPYSQNFGVQVSNNIAEKLSESSSAVAHHPRFATLLHRSSTKAGSTLSHATSVTSISSGQSASHIESFTPRTEESLSPSSLHGWVRVKAGSVRYADLTRTPGIRTTKFRHGIAVAPCNEDNAIVMNVEPGGLAPLTELRQLATKHNIQGDVRIFGAAEDRRWFDANIDSITIPMEHYALTLPRRYFALLPHQTHSQIHDHVVLTVSKARGVTLTGIPNDHFPLIKAHYASGKGSSSSPESSSLSSRGSETLIDRSPISDLSLRKHEERHLKPSASTDSGDMSTHRPGGATREDFRQPTDASTLYPPPPSASKPSKSTHSHLLPRSFQAWTHVPPGSTRLANLSRVRGIMTGRMTDGGVAVALTGDQKAIIANLDMDVPSRMDPLEIMKRLAVDNDCRKEAVLYLPHKTTPEIQEVVESVYKIFDEFKVKYRKQVKYRQYHFYGEAKMQIGCDLEVKLQIDMGKNLRFSAA